MDTMIYLFKVNIAIALFCVVYRAFYRKDTFFSMRRYVLLGALILSALYPLIDFSRWMMHNATMTDMALSYKNMLPEIVVYPLKAESPAMETTVVSHAVWDWFLWGYVSVAGLLLLRIAFRAMQIVWLRLKGQPLLIEGVRVSRLTSDTTPFSFFSWIFINPDLHDEKELHEVLAHERVHVRQRHSMDVLAAECMCAVCWINPMVWILKKEMQKNLEFIVDHCVINQGEIDAKSYQYHLLKLAYHPTRMALANQFNVSPLKERILMINSKQSPRSRLVAYMLVLPLVLMFFVVNNVGAVANRITQYEKVKDVVARVSHIVPDFSLEEITSEMRSVAPVESKRKPVAAATGNRKKEVSGVILNEETKMPLAGVNIVVYNTATGTITDANGRFRLMIHEGDTLKFSFIGFSGFTLAAQNLPADLGTLSMSRNSVELSEIYVVGYGRPSEHTPRFEMVTRNKAPEESDPEEMVFVAVEEMPQFPGGEPALLKYIADNLIYPEIAARNCIEGRVSCKFTIKEDGSVGNVRIIKSADPSLDDEAMRVIYSMPKWIPGEQRGKKVAVEYSIPVMFRLQKDKG